MLKIKVGDGWSTPGISIWNKIRIIHNFRTNNIFTNAGIIASSVEIKQLQCSVLNMSFFDQLTNANNNIVFESGNIRKRCDIEIEGFSTFDNLRGVRYNNLLNWNYY